jgi:hypothetical protein
MAIGARSLVNDRHQPDNQRMPRRFQFSLRAIFTLMTMVAVGCVIGQPIALAVKEGLTPSPRPQCRSILKQIRVALPRQKP